MGVCYPFVYPSVCPCVCPFVTRSDLCIHFCAYVYTHKTDRASHVDRAASDKPSPPSPTQRDTQLPAGHTCMVYNPVRACVCACVRACVRVCVCARLRASVRASVCPCVRVSLRPCVRACMHACIYSSVFRSILLAFSVCGRARVCKSALLELPDLPACTPVCLAVCPSLNLDACDCACDRACLSTCSPLGMARFECLRTWVLFGAHTHGHVPASRAGITACVRTGACIPL